MNLSTAIAHTHTEHTSSPTITPLTIQWACKNSVSNERSEEVSGRADCATSFMVHPFDQTRGNTRRRTTEQIAPDPTCPPSFQAVREIILPRPAQTSSSPNMSKLGRLPAQTFCAPANLRPSHNATPVVNVGLAHKQEGCETGSRGEQGRRKG